MITRGAGGVARVNRRVGPSKIFHPHILDRGAKDPVEKNDLGDGYRGIQCDAGLIAYRELDEALGLTASRDDLLADTRTGKNGWHGIVGLLRQSVYGRHAECEDVNDADRLGHDRAMRWIVGGKAVERGATSTSQMVHFET